MKNGLIAFEDKSLDLMLESINTEARLNEKVTESRGSGKPLTGKELAQACGFGTI